MTRPKPIDYREFEWQMYCQKHGLEDSATNRDAWLERLNSEQYVPYVVGFRLRFERKKSKLTQEEAAHAIGVAASTLASWEAGEHDISLRDAHQLMMLYQRFPGNRQEWDRANLNAITGVPMYV